MSFKISVIIPCFNSGLFLKEAIESIRKSEKTEYEIILVNDGSTDDFTLTLFNEFEGNGIKVIHQANQGPAAARNKGVFHSAGEYLLFLDSDNMVKPEYLKKALKILESSNETGVVYSKPFFFGGSSIGKDRFFSKEFSADGLLEGNFIDMCSVVRRVVFYEVGGFDEHKDLIGWEDWDFWIRISQTDWKFHFIDQELFEYRVRNESLMGTSDQIRKEKMLHYLGMKHGYLIHNRYRNYSRLIQKIEDKPFIFFLKIIFYKYILKKKYLTK